MERYLYEHAYIYRPFEHVCRLLESEPARVLVPATEIAVHRTDELVGNLRVGVMGAELTKAVRIEIGEYERYQDEVARLAFRWEAATHRALFPTMHADLEVYPLAHEPRPLCQLVFVGHYRPPLWLLGAAVDTMLGRRIAEASVHHFLKEVAVRVERELSPSGVGRYMG